MTGTPGSRRSSLRSVLMSAGIMTMAACVPTTDPSTATSTSSSTIDRAATQSADAFLAVDCLLPAQVRSLGRSARYLAPRRAIKTSQNECAIRGGEYVAYDRADLGTALSVWLADAQTGDPQAQTYVGEIFERGVGGKSDYQAAAEWYGRAAKQGFTQAMINLGQLHEQGLGVEKNEIKALNYYRQASGLGVAFVATEDTAAEITGLQEQLSIRERQLASLKSEVGTLEAELASEVERREWAQSEAKKRQTELAAAQNRIERERAELDRQSASLPPEASELVAERQELEKRARALEALEASFAAWAKELGAQEARQAEARAQTQAQADAAAEQRAAQLTTELAEARLELDNANRALAEAKAANVKTSEEETAQLAQLESSLNDWKDDLTRRESELADLRRTLEQQDLSIEQRRQDLVEQETSLARQQESLSAQETSLARQQESLSAQETSLVQQQESLSAQETSLAQRQQSISEQETSLATQETSLADEQRAFEQKRVEAGEWLASSYESIKKSQAVLTVQKAELDQQALRIDDREAELVALDDELKLRLDVVKRQEQNLEEGYRELATQQVAFDQRQKELARLNAEITLLGEQAQEKLDRIASVDNTEPTPVPASSEPIPPVITLIDPPLTTRSSRRTRSVTVRSGVTQRPVIGSVESDEPMLSVLVNDQGVELNERGVFKTAVPIDREEVPVSIIAVDESGHRSELDFTFKRAEQAAPKLQQIVVNSVEPLPQEPELDFGNFHALVIGNDSYRDLPMLESARQDARDVAEVLEQQYGMKVRLLLDATRYDILSALNDYRATLTENDNFVMYYAGHGELDEVNQRGHWLPIDAELDSTANWISNVQITDIINAMSAKRVLVVADSCYSGALTRSSLARLESGMSNEARQKWIKAMAGKKTRMTLTSGGLQPVLDSGGGHNSIFAKAFLDVLRANDGILEGQRLHEEVAVRVTYAADAFQFEQVPLYAPIKYAGHESGEFFFVPKS